MMSHFLCAVAVPPTIVGGAAGASEGDDKPTKFYTFCKVGSGYSRSELYEFNRRLAQHWTVFDKKSAPQWLELAPGFKQRPDAYIEPDKSAILQVSTISLIFCLWTILYCFVTINVYKKYIKVGHENELAYKLN